MSNLSHRPLRSALLRATLPALSLLAALACDVDDAATIDESALELADADLELADADLEPADGFGEPIVDPVSDGLDEAPAPNFADAPGDDALPVAPAFQMPVFVDQTWRASTYDGHYPNQNSIDLIRVGTSSLGAVVVASAPGNVVDVGPVTNAAGDYFGDYVNIDHGGGWETRYLHIDKLAGIVVGSTVVRGQRLGTVGQYPNMGVHLHYTQLLNGSAVRATFNGAQISVGVGTKKPDGTYPTQDIVSHNTPTGITVTSTTHGASVKSSEGAGVRAMVECMNDKDIETIVFGTRVAAKESSTASCPAGWFVLDRSFDF